MIRNGRKTEDEDGTESKGKGKEGMIGRASSGAITLTLASMLLLSGIWCMLLSPTVTYPQFGQSLHREISIDAFGNWTQLAS